MADTETWRARWDSAGVLSIPLQPNSKMPVSQWLHIDPAEQWRQADGRQANIGVLCGNGLAVVDCDDAQAVDNVAARLRSLGLALPAVATPSGGRHAYLKVCDAPAGFTMQRLAAPVGKGELRVRSCYVAAPCSSVDGRPYAFVNGSPEDLLRLRPVAWRDLLWLCRAQPSHVLPTEPPLRLVRRSLPQCTERLFALLAQAARGTAVLRYCTRSEAECAVVAALILAGWGEQEIEAEFAKRQPGHYREMGQHRRAYLHRTYRRALDDIAATPPRPAILDAYRAAHGMAWPGRTGSTDQAIYLALLAVAWQFARWTVAVSLRDLSEHAAVSIDTASHALTRLGAAKLIDRERDECAHPLAAHTYRIGQNKGTTVTYVRHWCIQNGYQELWAQARLGKIAGAVYAALSMQPQAVATLSARTGKHRNTVARALARLWQQQLAEPSRNGWIQGPARLSDVASDLRAPQTANKRRQHHELERAVWQAKTRPSTATDRT